MSENNFKDKKTEQNESKFYKAHYFGICYFSLWEKIHCNWFQIKKDEKKEIFMPMIVTLLLS